MDINFEKFGEAGLIVKYKGKINIEIAAEYISSICIRVILGLNNLMTNPKKHTIKKLFVWPVFWVLLMFNRGNYGSRI